MKKMINNMLCKGKSNVTLCIIALSMLIISLSSLTYCWIESTGSVAIGNSDTNAISAKIYNYGTACIVKDNTNTINLSNYIDNSSNLFFAPAKLANDGSLQILRNGNTYTSASTNDIGNNYIEFDVPFTVDARYKFSFTDTSKITVNGSTNNPIRVSVSVDENTAKVFDASLNCIADSTDRTAFSVLSGINHTLKVRIWCESTDENYNDASLKDKNVNINLTLTPEIDDSLRKVTIADSEHANISATYTEGGVSHTIEEGNTASVAPGTEITLTTKTADGIVSGENASLNGYMFKNINANDTIITSTVGDTDSITHIATTTANYTVTDGTKDIVISANTQRETFYIIGPGIIENGVWNSANGKTTLSSYDSVNNCVYGVFTANGTGDIFKIAEKGDKNTYRDSPKYCVSLNNSDVVGTGNITKASLDSQTSPNTCFTYQTSVSNEKILVIYYLDTNTVEIASGDEYVSQYTATALVNGTNGTAAVNPGNIVIESVAGQTADVKRTSSNKSVTFSAKANDGYLFVGWSTDTSGDKIVNSNAVYTTTLSSDLTLYANFKKAYTVTVTDNIDKVTGKYLDTGKDIIFTSGVATVMEGSNIDLIASMPDAANAYRVTWTVNGSTADTKIIKPGNTSSFAINNITANQIVAVSYERLYKLTITPISNCTYSAVDLDNNSITFSGNVAYVSAGTVARITAKSTETGNYNVVWKINNSEKRNISYCENTQVIDSYTTDAITSDTSVTINFTKLYKLTVKLDDTSLENSKVSVTFDGIPQILSNYYLPAGKTVNMTASNTNVESSKITADWKVSYGDGTTVSDEGTLTHSETIDATKGNVTVTVLVKNKPTIAECPQSILNGTKVSFYAGNNWGGTTMYIASENTNNAYDQMQSATNTITYDSKKYNYGSFAEVDSKNYYIKQNLSWAGKQIEENAQGGAFYGLYSSNSVNYIAKNSATTAKTTPSATEVELNSTGLTVSTTDFSSITSAVGTELYVQHFIKGPKDSDSEYKLLFTSDKIAAKTDVIKTNVPDEYAQTVGTLTVVTVLTDGTVYYVADTNSIVVKDPTAITEKTIYYRNAAGKTGTPKIWYWYDGTDGKIEYAKNKYNDYNNRPSMTLVSDNLWKFVLQGEEIKSNYFLFTQDNYNSGGTKNENETNDLFNNSNNTWYKYGEEPTPTTKRIYIQTSECSWFAYDSCYLVIKYSGQSDYISLKDNTITYNSKTYYYCDVPSDVSGINIARQNTLGTYNAYSVTSPSESQNCYTVNSDFNGGSWSTITVS